MRLVYTDDTIDDLKRLIGRIAAELVSRVELLLDSPKIGSPVELSPEPESIRDMIFGKYIVRHSIHQSTVIILRVWHDLENERS